MIRCLCVCAVSVLLATRLLAQAGTPPGENILFPEDTGLANVVKAPYNAKGDGKTDDTAAIQRALDENVGAIVYLPNGTYLVSDTLKWPGRQSCSTLWGESMAGAVLRLKDACPGYTDPGRLKAMVWTGQKPAQRFKNYIRNLTFDTGRGNPGAIGAQFISNNTGSFREVVIRSGDGRGAIGLDLGYTDEQGPCLVKNVRVIGFDIGISCRTAVDSITFEHITLENQAAVGLRNAGQCVSIRGLVAGGAPVAVENSGSAVMALLDARLSGKGAAAIVNSRPAALFARNVETSGFREAIRSDSGAGQGAAGPKVAEFVSHRPLSVWPSGQRSLGLEVKETPDVPWGDPRTWASVAKFGAQPGKGKDAPDSTEAVQKAIDSGAKTVYFPMGTFYVNGTVHIRGKVERIIGLGQNATTRGEGKFQFDDGDPPVVVIENMQGLAKGFVQASRRTAVLKNMAVQALGGLMTTQGFTATAPGDVFIEDVVCSVFQFAKGQRVWARQINTEREGTHILSDGAILWILGLKTERGGTLIHTRGGGKTEVCGGFCYTTTFVEGAPMFLCEDSATSITFGEANFSQKHGPFDPVVREVRGGQAKDLRPADCPHRTEGSTIPLFVGYPETKP